MAYSRFRNSDFKINTYYKKFTENLNEAKKHGKEVFTNEIRKLNNCYYARKLQGDVYIKDIFINYWPSFKEKYLSQLTRPGLVEGIEKFISCHNFDNGYLYYECPSCGDFYMMGFSCHSRMLLFATIFDFQLFKFFEKSTRFHVGLRCYFKMANHTLLLVASMILVYSAI